MSPKKELVLQAERFREDADLEFRIPSKKEILFILQQIAEQGTRVVLYFDDQQNFILTTLLGANSNGMWLDVGPFAPDNKRLLLSNKITFVSMHQHVKVQFTADAIQNVQLEGQDTFFMPLPPYLLRIQRRNNFRLNIPFGSPVKCVITIRPEDPQRPGAVEKTREISVLDISGGGIGLLCDESDPDLEKGNVFNDCRIFYPTLRRSRSGSSFVALLNSQCKTTQSKYVLAANSQIWTPKPATCCNATSHACRLKNGLTND